MLILTAALALLAADAGSTPSQGAAATPASTQPKADYEDPDKVICHNQPITGSRFVKRICMKRSEWSEQERRTAEQSRRFGEAAARNAASATGGGMVAQ